MDRVKKFITNTKTQITLKILFSIVCAACLYILLKVVVNPSTVKGFAELQHIIHPY